MSATLEIILIFLVVILLIWVWQKFWLSWLMARLQVAIKAAVIKMKENDKEEILKSKIDENDKRSIIREIDKEEFLVGERYITYRTRALGFITRIVGWGEIVFFGLLIFFILNNPDSFYKMLNSFFTIFGGWLAIKTVVHYDQWSQKRAGKAYFYVSLFGTFLNIIVAIGLGTLFHFWFISL